MANIHGAIAICEKRIATQWNQLAENRAALEKICAATEIHPDPATITAKQTQLQQLLEENRRVLQAIEKQYQALLGIRNR